MADVRSVGARLRLIMDGDSPAALLAAMPEYPYDVVLGVGGTPEGVATACALRALRGEIVGRFWARNDEERRRPVTRLRPRRAAHHRVGSCPATTPSTRSQGSSPGTSCQGVVYDAEGAVTESVVMRGRSGTVRWIRTRHRPEKLERFKATPRLAAPRSAQRRTVPGARTAISTAASGSCSRAVSSRRACRVRIAERDEPPGRLRSAASARGLAVPSHGRRVPRKWLGATVRATPRRRRALRTHAAALFGGGLIEHDVAPRLRVARRRSPPRRFEHHVDRA
jgi:hypothetical protein